jgi:hypothetical protein
MQRTPTNGTADAFCSAAEMAIEKYEKTAMQGCKNRPKTIDNDVKEEYKTRPPQTCGEKGI